jgi:hypothetical protein
MLPLLTSDRESFLQGPYEAVRYCNSIAISLQFPVHGQYFQTDADPAINAGRFDLKRST